MSRVRKVPAGAVWGLIAVLAAAHFAQEKAYLALGVEIVLALAVFGLGRTEGGQHFVGRLKLPVLAIVSAFPGLGARADPWRVVAAFATGDANKIGIALRPISETLLATTPLILAGLGVAVAFRSGVFNIGAEGQQKISAEFAA